MKRPSALLALALALVACPALATERFIAFGDSITEGFGDTAAAPGYPPKLRKILNEAGRDAVVENRGEGGETTFEALSRIDSVLAGGGDYFLLMEGTNDVTFIAIGEISIESTTANLDLMARKATARGFKSLMATVIPRPPKARRDPDNVLTRELNWNIYELAAANARPQADPWRRFSRFLFPDALRTLYADIEGDFVGHPNGAGYQAIAELFADQILGIDRVPPVPGRFAPYVTELDGETEFTASLFESAAGSGIKLKKTYFEINGEPVAKPLRSSSNKRVAHFRYTGGRKELGCRVVLGFSGGDRAAPPNEFSQLFWAYGVAGREHLVADIDGDCTVDALDLEQFRRGFGAEFGDLAYSVLLDLNSDDVIDGYDLAIFASSFGASTP